MSGGCREGGESAILMGVIRCETGCCGRLEARAVRPLYLAWFPGLVVEVFTTRP